MKDWVQPYVKKYRFQMVFALICGILGVGSGAMLLFVSGYLISKSALQPENIMIVYVPIVSVRAFSIGQAAFLYVEKLISHDFVLKVLEKMRSRLYRILEPQALFLRSRYQTGDLLSTLSDDIEHLQDLYLKTILPGTLGLLIYSVIIGVFGFFNVPFAILMLLMLGILVFLLPLVSFYYMKHRHKTLKKQRSTMYEHITDAIFGLSDWQASGRTAQFLSDVDEQNQAIHQTERHMQRWHHIRNGIAQLVIGCAIIAIMIWSNAEVDRGTLTPTLIAAFTLMMFSITDALKPISEAVENFSVYTDSIDRLKKIQHEQPTTTQTRENTMIEQPTIHIQNVFYQYPDSPTKALDNVSLRIHPGEKVAILGQSGAGKSTLLKLLAGVLQPTQGHMLLNDQHIHSDMLAHSVSVMNQSPHLFATTIANNIRIGQPKASNEAVLKVIEQAQLRPLIESLPDGMHTHAREMGSRFSGGERQRIALARVLLQDTPIVLIDEATVGLDPKTEHALLDTILRVTEDKTVIWITHHLAHIEKMDHVVFFKNGRITMQGNHQQLLETNTHYQTLYKMDRGL